MKTTWLWAAGIAALAAAPAAATMPSSKQLSDKIGGVTKVLLGDSEGNVDGSPEWNGGNDPTALPAPPARKAPSAPERGVCPPSAITEDPPPGQAYRFGSQRRACGSTPTTPSGESGRAIRGGLRPR